MKIVDEIIEMQKKSNGTVILIKSGVFYLAYGKDAIFLEEQIGLKCTCMKNGMCKVGFPVTSKEKFAEKMKKKDIPFKMYESGKDGELKIITQEDGKNKNTKTEMNKECSKCSIKSEKEAKKKKTENKSDNYLAKTKKFCIYTIDRCLRLPKRWDDALLKGLYIPAQKMLGIAARANALYVEPKKQEKSECIEALEKRIKYLNEALEYNVVFKTNFDVLVNFLDLNEKQSAHIKEKINQLIKEEMEKINKEHKDSGEAIKIDVKVVRKADEMNYIALNGKENINLKLKQTQLDQWLKIETDAEEEIKQRIQKDRILVKKLKG